MIRTGLRSQELLGETTVAATGLAAPFPEMQSMDAWDKVIAEYSDDDDELARDPRIGLPRKISGTEFSQLPESQRKLYEKVPDETSTHPTPCINDQAQTTAQTEAATEIATADYRTEISQMLVGIIEEILQQNQAATGESVRPSNNLVDTLDSLAIAEFCQSVRERMGGVQVEMSTMLELGSVQALANWLNVLPDVQRVMAQQSVNPVTQ